MHKYEKHCSASQFFSLYLHVFLFMDGNSSPEVITLNSGTLYPTCRYFHPHMSVCIFTKLDEFSNRF